MRFYAQKLRPIAGTLVLTLCLSGCGPSAEQKATQALDQARAQQQQRACDAFREALAAMKVCTRETNYREFHERKLALQSCYIVHQKALAEVRGIADIWMSLDKVMNDCETAFREWLEPDKAAFIHDKYGALVSQGLDLINEMCGNLISALEREQGNQVAARPG